MTPDEIAKVVEGLEAWVTAHPTEAWTPEMRAAIACIRELGEDVAGERSRSYEQGYNAGQSALEATIAEQEAKLKRAADTAARTIIANAEVADLNADLQATIAALAAEIERMKFPDELLKDFIGVVASGEVSQRIAVDLYREMVGRGEPSRYILSERGSPNPSP